MKQMCYRILDAMDYLTIECEKNYDYYTCVVVEFDEGDGLDWVILKRGDNFTINGREFWIEGQRSIDLSYAYAPVVQHFRYEVDGCIRLLDIIKQF